jgi:hypothetical protein
MGAVRAARAGYNDGRFIAEHAEYAEAGGKLQLAQELYLAGRDLLGTAARDASVAKRSSPTNNKKQVRAFSAISAYSAKNFRRFDQPERLLERR